jgi:UDP-N-acetylmuramoyl-tripeptide--D-alanyl-D-alanine ligase
VLSQFDETVAPKESFNNEIGLPLTILKCTQMTKYLVLEFGALKRTQQKLAF